MTDTSLDLDSLRELVLKSQSDEEKEKERTKLITECNNPNRRKIKKVNPKFCSEWNQLDQDLQINRIIEYVSRYSEEQDLTPSTGKKIRQLLVKALIEENLEVEYDSTVGIIVNIPKLYYTDEEGYFLGTYLNNQGELTCRISKIATYSNNQQNGIAILTEEYQDNKKKDPIPAELRKTTLTLKRR